MNINNIIKIVSDKAARIGFVLKKHSPEILVAAGVVGTVTAAVLACKATTKVPKIIDDAKKDIELVHQIEDMAAMSEEPVPKEEVSRALTRVYLKTGLKFIKIYAPSVALGALSLTGIITSHNILRKRNMALAAAYVAVDKGFKEYRSRVVERFGEEVDHELRYNIQTKKFETTTVDDKGKEKKTKETVKVVDPNTYSIYSRFFDESSPCWEKNAEYNLMYLKNQQSYANDMLRVRGHLYLNEVYDMLGLERSKAGQIVGWTYNEKNPTGDNYVDFGIFDVNRERVRDFVNGYERSILLDFNVDGPILNSLND